MPGWKEKIDLKSALEAIAIQAMTASDGSLPLGESFNFAALSARDQIYYAPPAAEMRILSSRACDRKRAEFTAGRAAAHLALRKIGFENPPPVLRGENGEPSWPDGVVGSITHCYPWSIAVAGRFGNDFAIGIDLESVERVQATDISSLICGDAELGWIRDGGCDFQERLTMIFSAKEAVYKAFYPLCRQYIDFKEVELVWLPEQYRFQGKFLMGFDTGLLPGHQCQVHCRRYGDLIFSFLVHQPT